MLQTSYGQALRSVTVSGRLRGPQADDRRAERTEAPTQVLAYDPSLTALLYWGTSIDVSQRAVLSFSHQGF